MFISLPFLGRIFPHNALEMDEKQSVQLRAFWSMNEYWQSLHFLACFYVWKELNLGPNHPECWDVKL